MTEAEAPKYKVRFRSAGSFRRGAKLQHDHVYERAEMADALIANPLHADKILDLAIGCVVTKDEHSRLAAISRLDPGLNGWERYRETGIVVLDTFTGSELNMQWPVPAFDLRELIR